jgi:signal transduction histidine kinase
VVWPALPTSVRVGDSIEVAGVIAKDVHSPLTIFGISEARIRGAPPMKVAPIRVTKDSFHSYGGRFIETTLRFRDMEQRRQTMVLFADRSDTEGRDPASVEWLISDVWRGRRFTQGDLLKVRGVAEFRGLSGQPPLTILVRSPEDISILEPAPWWKRMRWDMVAGVAITLLAISMAAVAVSRRQVKLVLAERKRIARELHDTLLQGFSGLILQLEAMTQQFPEHFHSGRSELSAILSEMERYLGDARDSISELRRSASSVVSFADQLRFMAEQQSEGTGVYCEFRLAGSERRLSRAIEGQLYRIASEAVANALRHSKPQHLNIVLEFLPSGVRLTVADDGCGFDEQSIGHKQGHFGLKGMRERAAELKGELQIDTAAGKGCQLQVTVPA